MKNIMSRVIIFCKNNPRLIFLCSGAFILNVGLLIFSIVGSPAGKLGILLLIIMFLIANAIAICGIVIIIKKKYPIEKVFLIFGLLYGLLMVFALPIGRMPDEPAHFWRAYELSEFKFFAETTDDGEVGYYLPTNLKGLIRENYTDNAYAEIWSSIGEPASQERAYTRGPADSYFAFNYIPQALGILVGRAIGLPLIPIAYLARLFNMVFCVLIVYFCIKYIPIFKKLLFLIGFMPMVMQAFASVSADASIICGGIILVSFTLYMIYGTKRTITKRDLLLILCACLMLAVTKPVYAPLCFILFFIPKERFNGNKNKIFSIFAIGAITFGLFLLITATLPAGGAPRYEAGPEGQLAYILQNPFRYAGNLAKAMMEQIMLFITLGIGGSLEWYSVKLAEISILLYILAFILICTEGEAKAKLGFKVFSGLAFAISSILIFTALYLSWSETGSPIFDGIQGRYFLPLVMLIPICFLPLGENTLSNKKRLAVSNASIYILTFFTMAQTVVAIIGTHI